MRRKRLYFPVVAVMLLLLVAGVVMAQDGTTSTPEAVDLSDVKEDAVRDLLDSKGRVIDPNETLARISRDNEGGFGGWYLSEDEGTAYVYMTDTTKTAAAETAFNSAFDWRGNPDTVVVIEGDYTLEELDNWLDLTVGALAAEAIHFWTFDIDIEENKAYIYLNESSSLEDAVAARDRLGIPADAVEITQPAGKVGLLGGDDLQDKWRPLVGGIQHQQETDGQKCTIGFVTERDGEKGILLASHCTNEAQTVWGLDNAVIHQPVDPWGPLTNTVAEETIDPEGRGYGHYLCSQYDYICRYSDAAYAELDSDEDLDLGHIAEPEDYNTIEVSPAYDTLEINSDSGNFRRNEEIEVIGRTTGWQKGIVTDTCTFVIVKEPAFGNPGKVVVCAGAFRPASGFDGPSHGDSGGPVFKRDGNDVQLLGTLFYLGINRYYFSKTGYIYYDLDWTAHWDTCTAGC